MRFGNLVQIIQLSKTLRIQFSKPFGNIKIILAFLQFKNTAIIKYFASTNIKETEKLILKLNKTKALQKIFTNIPTRIIKDTNSEKAPSRKTSALI